MTTFKLSQAFVSMSYNSNTDVFTYKRNDGSGKTINLADGTETTINADATTQACSIPKSLATLTFSTSTSNLTAKTHDGTSTVIRFTGSTSAT